jgi:valyl-tRNA synthetase
MVQSISAKLANQNFIRRAPADVVAKERDKLESFNETAGKLRKNYEALS